MEGQKVTAYCNYHASRCRKLFTRNINFNNCFSPNSWLWDTCKEVTNNKLVYSLNTNSKINMRVKQDANNGIKIEIGSFNLKVTKTYTWWSWLHPDSPTENLVGWMGGCALSSYDHHYSGSSTDQHLDPKASTHMHPRKGDFVVLSQLSTMSI